MVVMDVVMMWRLIMVKIDYNFPITREHLDMEAYKKKFARLSSWMTSKERDPLEYGKLLLDPTCFAYLHQRIDGDRLIYYPYQDAIANDSHRFKYFRAANQIGKSLLLDSLAARNLIWDHGHSHNEAIVSKSLPQSTFQMRRVKALLRTMPEIHWEDVRGQTDSLSVISVDIKDEKGNVKYTNYLICAPSTEGLLGYDLHSLNLDEFEFWDVDLKYFFNQIAQPRTYSTKGSITVFSNPNGADNFGSELENQKDLEGNRKWHVYCFNYLDKPGNTQREYDQLKMELSRQEFESTVAAIRSISDRNYFTPEEIERSFDPNLTELKMIGKQPFFFLDIGAKHDRSVMIGGYIEPDEHNSNFVHLYIPIIHCYPIGYPLTRVAGVNIDNSDGWHVEKSVKDYLKEWTINGVNPTFGYDITGNSGMKALFEAIGIYGVDTTFSGPAKSGWYQRFKYYMEKGLLHRIKNKQWEYEASHLIMEKSQRGYLLIHHEEESDRDDCMDATAGLIHLTWNTEIVIPSLTLIGGRKR